MGQVAGLKPRELASVRGRLVAFAAAMPTGSGQPPASLEGVLRGS